jgi:hypothetical protein
MVQPSVKTVYPTEITKSTIDQVFNYGSNLLELGLIERNFKDAWSDRLGWPTTVSIMEGKMLYFRQSGHVNYASEGFLFEAG